MSSSAPPDRYYTVLGIICLLGVASLLPWNVLITQAEYLTIRAHEGVLGPSNWWADQIVTLTANCYLFANLATFLLLLPLGKHVSIHAQISLPLCIAAAIVLVQAWIAYETRLSSGVFIGSTLLSTAVLGAATAPMTSATYALASFLPPLYIQALVLGQSIAGVATSVLSFATIWGTAPGQHELPTSEDVSLAAVTYFLACGAVVCLGILGYWLLPTIDFVQHWTLREGSGNDETIQFAPLSERSESNMQTVIKSMVNESRAKETRRLFSRPSSQALEAEGGGPETDITILELSNQLKGYDYCVGLVFLVSLAAFPGMVACICSVQNGATVAPCLSHPPAGRFYGNLFQPFLFLLFNAGDAAGRALAGLHTTAISSPILFAYCGVRTIICLGIALCNVVPSKPWLLPALMWSDFWPAALSGLLGLTNGHLATIALIEAPKLVQRQFRDRTGALMSFSLSLGLSVGGLISVALLSGLQSHSTGQ